MSSTSASLSDSPRLTSALQTSSSGTSPWPCAMSSRPAARRARRRCDAPRARHAARVAGGRRARLHADSATRPGGRRTASSSAGRRTATWSPPSVRTRLAFTTGSRLYAEVFGDPGDLALELRRVHEREPAVDAAERLEADRREAVAGAPVPAVLEAEPADHVGGLRVLGEHADRGRAGRAARGRDRHALDRPSSAASSWRARACCSGPAGRARRGPCGRPRPARRRKSVTIALNWLPLAGYGCVTSTGAIFLSCARFFVER